MKNKMVIVINGKGGVGKDTLCLAAAEKYCVTNISSITPIKEIAKTHGWNGEKDDKSRKFLADLKQIFADYNDLPNRYLLQEYNSFLSGNGQILFVHIRESDQIEKFVKGTDNNCITLLITRNTLQKDSYGNRADDDVLNYNYNEVFDNSLPIKESSEKFIEFIETLQKKYQIKL